LLYPAKILDLSAKPFFSCVKQCATNNVHFLFLHFFKSIHWIRSYISCCLGW